MPKPTIPEVRPLVQALYATDGGGAGCCLHIVLDDSNIEDGSVEFCIGWAQKHSHPDCEKLGRLLLQMSKTQRLKLARGG